LLRVVLVIGLVAAGCSGGSGSATIRTRSAGTTGSVAVLADRFPHALHTGNNPQIRGWQGRGLQCVDCHAAADVKAGRVARPGGSPTGPSIQQHAPCDDCHRDEFAKPPGPLCKVCHVSVDPMVKGASVMKAFPDTGIVQSLASTFSHRAHLDASKMEAAVGAHVSCTDCHERDATTGTPILPSHKQCLTCHDKAQTAKRALPMERCDGCHLRRDVEIARGRIFITGDLRFSHQRHETDQAGATIACTMCHENVADSSTREDMAVPAMARCAQCHEDAGRSPDRVRMARCGVCHATIQDGAPPTNHMMSGAVPTDHTLEFRTHHADQAIAKDANCRRCHPVSGRPEDSCFQCHLAMRPRDHSVMFRDDHGREAEADATRCGTCHAPETCTACHSVPPRSHTPIAEFRQGGHAEQARFNLTACLTCHTYQTTCVQCHRGTR
jgi:hypothetical protein